MASSAATNLPGDDLPCEDASPGPIYLTPGPADWQRRWFLVIFGHKTPAGKAFDLLLLVVIVISVAAVMLESVVALQAKWQQTFDIVEWIITLLFSLEFIARIACVKQPWRYVFSFFGMVDIISLLPSYLGLFYRGADSLATIRTLRLLRVFRVLKLARHVEEAQGLLASLRQTWPKITVFISVLFCLIIILGTVMYLVESSADSGFDDIPTSVYWAIVTMTTVGYGDIAPATALGKIIAAVMMLLGYAIIIVPTGIFSAQVIAGRAADQLAEAAAARAGERVAREVLSEASTPTRTCGACEAEGLSPTANYCEVCGASLDP